MTDKVVLLIKNIWAQPYRKDSSFLNQKIDGTNFEWRIWLNHEEDNLNVQRIKSGYYIVLNPSTTLLLGLFEKAGEDVCSSKIHLKELNRIDQLIKDPKLKIEGFVEERRKEINEMIMTHVSFSSCQQNLIKTWLHWSQKWHWLFHETC